MAKGIAKGISVQKAEPLLVAGAKNGITVIPSPTPLTRLHYFDGKFLRAKDLELEQTYLRQLVFLSNQAGGSGVVHGFDCDLAGNALELGSGLAIDGEGRVLLLPAGRTLDLAALLEASRQRYAESLPKPLPFPGGFGCCEGVTGDPGTLTEGATFYLIAICHAEALCGEEDVYGKLCAPACATSTARPYSLEGVVVRALPLDLASPLPSSPASPVALTGKHLESRVASAYFADERAKAGSLITAGGLASGAWCHGAAAAAAGCVPLALVARAGSQTLFLDTWTVRRERIEAPPRRYWAGRLAQRPWDVFLAQVLQFQCQLAHCLGHGPADPDDPCSEAHALLRATAEQLAGLIRGAAPATGSPVLGADNPAGAGRLDYQKLEEIRGRLADAVAVAGAPATQRRLLQCGIVELPSAGYLPIELASAQTVNQQVFALMGESVDLRFCVARPDFVPHAFEEAQHMDRISLLRGYDQPNDKPRVDILVPDGEIVPQQAAPAGFSYVLDLEIASRFLTAVRRLVAESPPDPAQTPFAVRGAARGAAAPGGALAFYYAGFIPPANPVLGGQNTLAAPPTQTPFTFFGNSLWLGAELGRDPFELAANEETTLTVEALLLDSRDLLTLRWLGELRVIGRAQNGETTLLSVRASGSLAITRKATNSPTLKEVLDIDEELTLERRPGTGLGAANSIRILQSQLFAGVYRRIEGGRRWTAAGQADIGGEAIDANSGAKIALFDGNLKADDQALLPGNLDHIRSIAALTALGNRLGDPSFADSRGRRLFPPAPAPSSSELLVKARLPWVLFHRRREKTCAAGAPPVEVAARRFRLYHVALEERSSAEELLEQLRQGKPLDGTPEYAATVEFAGGLAAVQNPLPLLRDSWDALAEDGAKLLLGALAGQGAVVLEGETLAQARLSALATVLEAVTPADEPELALLDQIHPQLPANGLDGAIVYATWKAPVLAPGQNLPGQNQPGGSPATPVVATQCQAIFVLDGPITPLQLKEGRRLITTSSFEAAGAVGFTGLALTAMQFPATSADGLGDSVQQTVDVLRQQLPDRDPARMQILTVSQHGSSTAERKLHEKRSKALLDAMGGLALVTGSVDGGKVTFPFECPAVSVLFVPA